MQPLITRHHNIRPHSGTCKNCTNTICNTYHVTFPNHQKRCTSIWMWDDMGRKKNTPRGPGQRMFCQLPAQHDQLNYCGPNTLGDYLTLLLLINDIIRYNRAAPQGKQPQEHNVYTCQTHPQHAQIVFLESWYMKHCPQCYPLSCPMRTNSKSSSDSKSLISSIRYPMMAPSHRRSCAIPLRSNGRGDEGVVICVESGGMVAE